MIAIKRILTTLLFRLHNPRIIFKGKGMINRIHCKCNGIRNIVHIEAGASLSNCKILFKGNQNYIHISCGTHLIGTTFWCEGDNNKIEIGKMVTMERSVELDACEGKSIIINDDCMLSHDIAIRTTDSHSITDAQGRRINPAKDIFIGKHVWIGMECTILKGSTISDNCIVGAKSLVSGSLKSQENSLITGNPAKVIKSNINWHRELL